MALEIYTSFYNIENALKEYYEIHEKHGINNILPHDTKV